MPASASAICWASVAGIETGDIAPMSRKGVMIVGLVGLRVGDQRAEHAVVEAQRRVDVDQRQRRRRGLDRLAPAEEDLPHRDRVLGVGARRHRAHVGLVRQRLQRVDHVEMARVQRLVVGLADRAARRVELGEGLRQAHEVLEVVHRRLAADVALADERAAVDRGEGHVLAAEVDARARGCAPAASNSRGALATCSSTNSGSRIDAFSSSTCWPAARKASTASGSRNSIPISVTIRRQPRSSTAMASSLRIS